MSEELYRFRTPEEAADSVLRLCNERDVLRAENARLRRALEEIVERAYLPDYRDDRDHELIKVGSLRKARAALKGDAS